MDYKKTLFVFRIAAVFGFAAVSYFHGRSVDPSFDLENVWPVVVAGGAWLSFELPGLFGLFARQATKNDIRVGREFLKYEVLFKSFLHDAEWHKSISPAYAREANAIMYEFDDGNLLFQNKSVQRQFLEFMDRFNKFMNVYAKYTTSQEIHGQTQIRIVPFEVDYYAEKNSRYKNEVKEVADAAKLAWEALQNLSKSIRKHLPETFNDPIKSEWIRTTAEQRSI